MIILKKYNFKYKYICKSISYINFLCTSTNLKFSISNFHILRLKSRLKLIYYLDNRIKKNKDNYLLRIFLVSRDFNKLHEA